MKIFVTNIYVDDQQKALQFYTEKLGFLKKQDVPLGQYSWLTVVSKDDVNGVELLLEPSEHAAVSPYQNALRQDGIPALSLSVENIDEEYLRLKERGVSFHSRPIEVGNVKVAVFDDTCGNLIQLVQL